MDNQNIPQFRPYGPGRGNISQSTELSGGRSASQATPPFMNPIAPLSMCKPGRQPEYRRMNHGEHRTKYFYTILFLDNYYQSSKNTNNPVIPTPKSKGGELKNFEICQDSNVANVKWIDETRLYVRHNLQMPITLQLVDNERKPLIYCPILKEGVDNMTFGDVQVESQRAIIIHFDNIKKPEYNEIYKLTVRSLPDFSLDPEQNDVVATKLSDFFEIPKVQQGLAIIFRRNSLDGLYDLIAEFDQAYYHSMDESSELKYLTQKSCYKDLHFTTKFTNNLQDVMDLIDINYYNVQYSWEDHKKYRG